MAENRPTWTCRLGQLHKAKFKAKREARAWNGKKGVKKKIKEASLLVAVFVF